jgi:hypothetical protein
MTHVVQTISEASIATSVAEHTEFSLIYLCETGTRDNRTIVIFLGTGYFSPSAERRTTHLFVAEELL